MTVHCGVEIHLRATGAGSWAGRDGEGTQLDCWVSIMRQALLGALPLVTNHIASYKWKRRRRDTDTPSGTFAQTHPRSTWLEEVGSGWRAEGEKQSRCGGKDKHISETWQFRLFVWQATSKMLFWETNNLAPGMAKWIYFKIPVNPLLLNVLQLLLSFIHREAVLGIGAQRFEYTSYNVNLNAVTVVSHFISPGRSFCTYRKRTFWG